MVELQMMTATATVSQDQNDDDGDEDTQQWRWYDDGAMTRTVSISQCDHEAVNITRLLTIKVTMMPKPVQRLRTPENDETDDNNHREPNPNLSTAGNDEIDDTKNVNNGVVLYNCSNIENHQPKRP